MDSGTGRKKESRLGSETGEGEGEGDGEAEGNGDDAGAAAAAADADEPLPLDGSVAVRFLFNVLRCVSAAAVDEPDCGGDAVTVV